MTRAAHLLIIDDDATLRFLMTRLFSSLGYRVSEAADGMTAFAQARLLKPDLLLLDLGLPGQDGWSVMREIRAEPVLEGLPILGITAHSSAVAIRTAYDAGSQYVLLKPFALETLVEKVHALLVSSKLPQTAQLSLPVCIGVAARLHRSVSVKKQAA